MENIKIFIRKINEQSEIPTSYQDKLKNLHPNRINEYLSARKLLASAIEGASLENLEETSHQTLLHFPDIVFSLSHTEGFVACLVSQKNYTPHIGLDIEKASRTFNQNITRYLDHEEDIPIKTLHKWVLKEAAFKYFSSKYKRENFWFKNIILKDGIALYGEDKVYTTLIEKEGLLIGVALPIKMMPELFLDLKF